MTNDELYQLMDRFERSSLSGLKLTRGDCSVELSRILTAAQPAAAAPISAPAAAEASTPNAEGSMISAPMVGTFYTAPAPGEDPYVRVGDRVTKGQTVCLMEAMKMMSEIPAPCDCVIEAVLKEDGSLAAFGDGLFRYRAV